MDLQEWEVLSMDGLVDFHDDGDEGKAFSRKRTSHADSFVDADYFRCPSPKSWKFVDPTGGDSRISRQILPVAVRLEARTEKEPDPDEDSLKEVTEMVLDDECKVQEKVEKTTEDEFADMKLDSPKFSAAGVKGFVPTIDAFFFDEPSEVNNKKRDCCSNWGLSGVRALCSFGVAAATVCVLIVGNRNCTAKQNRNFTFQIYTDDKRIKQVVEHASKLNEAISGVRGAHITFGGYYDGL